MSVDSASFKKALGSWPSGVTVVTVRTGDGWHGMTASAFSSLSLDPPLVLVCVKRGAQMHRHLLAADGFAVNILAEGQKSVSNWFAGYRPDESAVPALRPDVALHSQAPLLAGAVAMLDCSRHAILDGGDHEIFVGLVHGVEVSEAEAPLLYARGRYRALGTEL